MSETQTSVETFTRVPCCECGMVFFVPARFDEVCREDGRRFYCPSGHHLSYGGGENARLKKQLENAQERATNLSARIDSLRVQRDAEERRRLAQKSATTRLKNRIKAGACPCCSKRFPDVAAHVNDMHPTFAEESK